MREQLIALRILVITLLLFGSIALFGASPKRGHSKFLVHYPNVSAAAQLPFDDLDAEVLEDYQSMRLGYVKAADAPILQARAAELGQQVVLADDFDRLFPPGGALDVRLGTEGSLPGRTLRAPYPAGRHGLYLIQFIGPPKADWVSRLAGFGATVIEWVPVHGAIVSADGDAFARVRALPFVQFADIYHPFLKAGRLDPTRETRDYLIQLAAAPDIRVDRTAIETLAEILPKVIPSSRSTELWLQARMTRETVLNLLELPLVVGVFDIPRYASSDERVAMSLTRLLDGGGAPTTPTRYKKWLENICGSCGSLSAEGFKVGVADTPGLDGGTVLQTHHADLPLARTEYGSNFANSSNAAVYDPNLKDFRGHATMVAGIVAGDPSSAAGAGAGGFLYGQGVAPSAKVLITALDMNQPLPGQGQHPPGFTFTPIATTANDARVRGAYIQNHSYNRYTSQACVDGTCPVYYDGIYDLTASQADSAVRDLAVTLVISSGNANQQARNAGGYYVECADPTSSCPVPHPAYALPLATAKNVISVGGSENFRDGSEQWTCHTAVATGFSNVMANSKQGTRIAGYIKPDLLAPASSIASLRTTQQEQQYTTNWCNYQIAAPPTDIALNNSNYILSTGTSFAAPVVAGAAVLASRRFSSTPSAAKPSLVKAMLIAGAKSMRGGTDKRTNTPIGPIPNTQQGFGRIHLEEVLSSYPSRVYVNESVELLQSGSTQTDNFKVHDPSLPVKVVLVWSDPAATPEDGVALGAGGTETPPPATFIVNNLNLTVNVNGSCANRFLGNRLSSIEESTLYNCTTGTSDTLNNVEYIRFLPSSLNPAITDFSVEVRLNNGTQSQRYSLVVYNAYPANGSPSPSTPSSITATAAQNLDLSWRADVTWPTATGATGYEVHASSLDGAFTQVYSGAATNFSHAGLVAGRTYLYKVRATNGQGMSDFSPIDPATSVFLPDSIVAGTVVKATHISSLRDAVNAFRAAAGLATTTFTDPTLTTGQSVVRAPHLTQLRTALDAARQNILLSLYTYTDPTITATGTTIRAVHVNELRQGVQ